MNLFTQYNNMKLMNESSEAFHKWFGKSVLHDNNVPQKFYHGTKSDIPAFSHNFIGSGNDSYGSGFYFTNKPDVASSYAIGTDDKSTPNVIPVHLKVTKPIIHDDPKPFNREHIRKLIMASPDYEENLNNFDDVSRHGVSKVLNYAASLYADSPKMNAIHSLHNDFYQDHPAELLKNITKITGHDGIIVKNGDHTIVNVFHPNQIKSSIGNNGNYSSKSDNITENSN